ncbi:hypothetical protein [Streptomyces pseudovenezuelae]|uniref:hypothetical protein n=1 Tax=Streptomyces pseudovenezuelae TaxID=67350 RepID=UPI0024763D1A|nr:hypothetical protein [Streptomyces pseudovenezuelae]
MFYADTSGKRTRPPEGKVSVYHAAKERWRDLPQNYKHFARAFLDFLPNAAQGLSPLVGGKAGVGLNAAGIIGQTVLGSSGLREEYKNYQVGGAGNVDRINLAADAARIAAAVGSTVATVGGDGKVPSRIGGASTFVAGAAVTAREVHSHHTEERKKREEKTADNDGDYEMGPLAGSRKRPDLESHGRGGYHPTSSYQTSRQPLANEHREAISYALNATGSSRSDQGALSRAARDYTPAPSMSRHGDVKPRDNNAGHAAALKKARDGKKAEHTPGGRGYQEPTSQHTGSQRRDADDLTARERRHKEARGTEQPLPASYQEQASRHAGAQRPESAGPYGMPTTRISASSHTPQTSVPGFNPSAYNPPPRSSQSRATLNDESAHARRHKETRMEEQKVRR